MKLHIASTCLDLTDSSEVEEELSSGVGSIHASISSTSGTGGVAASGWVCPGSGISIGGEAVLLPVSSVTFLIPIALLRVPNNMLFMIP